MANKERQWERVQERAFTQWMAQTLQPLNMPVQDLRIDIQDGLKMIRFFETLSGKKVKQGYDKTPKNRIAKINNLSVALSFLPEMGIHNPGCFPEDVIDAEKKGIKMILGLLWVLFRRFKMSEVVEGGSKGKEEDAILEWVRKTTKGYDGFEITNFKTSFNNGKAFLALVHAYNKEDPEFDYDEYCNTMSVEETLQSAFDMAEKQLGVTKLLDVQEFLEGNIDERSVALYTTLFVSAYKAKEKMLALQHDLGDKQNALSIESRSREELAKLNSDLGLQQAQLQKALADEQEHAKSLDALCDELKKENLANAELLKQLRLEYQTLLDTYEQLSSQNDAELEKKLQQERAEREEKEKVLQSEKDLLKQLEAEYERLKAELEAKKSENDECTAGLRTRSRRTKTNINGLKTVHSNLDQHIDDLVRWQRYLPGTAANASVDEYMLLMNEELEKLKAQPEFEEHVLEAFVKRFAEEKIEMEKLLAQRKELEKTTSAKKKK